MKRHKYREPVSRNPISRAAVLHYIKSGGSWFALCGTEYKDLGSFCLGPHVRTWVHDLEPRFALVEKRIILHLRLMQNVAQGHLLSGTFVKLSGHFG